DIRGHSPHRLAEPKAAYRAEPGRLDTSRQSRHTYAKSLGRLRIDLALLTQLLNLRFYPNNACSLRCLYFATAAQTPNARLSGSRAGTHNCQSRACTRPARLSA